MVALSETPCSTASIMALHLTFTAKGMACLAGPIDVMQDRAEPLFSLD